MAQANAQGKAIAASSYGQKPRARYGQILLVLNGAILAPTALGAAALVVKPSLSVFILVLYPFILLSAIILVADSITLSALLIRVASRKTVLKPKMVALTVTGWVLLAASVAALAYVRFLQKPTLPTGSEPLTEQQAAQLVQNCQVSSFYRNSVDPLSGATTDIYLVYKGNVVDKAGIQHHTSIDNWYSLVTAAQTSSCGGVTTVGANGGQKVLIGRNN